MGVELVVLFISSVLFLCGFVLVFGAGDMSGRKAGFFMLMIGIFGIFIGIIAYPRDRHYVPYYEYSNQTSTDYNTADYSNNNSGYTR